MLDLHEARLTPSDLTFMAAAGGDLAHVLELCVAHNDLGDHGIDTLVDEVLRGGAEAVGDALRLPPGASRSVANAAKGGQGRALRLSGGLSLPRAELARCSAKCGVPSSIGDPL